MKYYLVFVTLALLVTVSCEPKVGNGSEDEGKISDDSLFNLVQYRTFQYFWDGAEPTSGLARERYHVDGEYPQDDRNVVTSGGGGFGVMAILVGIERGFISKEEGVERLNKIVEFLEKADKFHGAFPHWWHGETGKVKPFSEKDDGGDLVETAFMVQGLLTVRQYLRDGDEEEKALANRIDDLWKAVDFNFYRNERDVLLWHWSPNYGWEMNHEVRGYNECLIMYVLAAASPTHPIPTETYHQGWARAGEIKNDEDHEAYGHHLSMVHNGNPEKGGPLFWAHYSYLGLDPRTLKDEYADYWEHNTNHTLINRAWCVENPLGYEGYGPQSWGLTSSYSVNGYSGHAPAESRDKGVITPTAALSSMPYTPEYSKETMRYWYDELGDKLFGKFGFYDAFSETEDWFPQRYLAIDQGPIVVMMENHRSGLLWDLFMSCPEVQEGLDKLGFEY
ncbi:glucoamylase family protein [Pleomorphovibrio marinus]|uniref:glucoamylase family protein n=1 Tax=Pleomorphovibrio marinus TaxID=2164132 RepID=UPI000E0A62F0|nr:glucoamylase family protein [Pleomorphovibrio marinus]